jgi:hypothetical protein
MLKRMMSLVVLVGAQAGFVIAQPPAPPAPPASPETDDPAAVYRYDPFLNQLVPVPPAEVKPGFLYSRHSPRLNRRVWSLAREGGGFEYAMAPGSVQPARALDLRATPEQQRAVLEARAPDLARIMDIRGTIAHMRLTEDGAWQLVRQQTIASVLDMETGRRWEWHGPRRVAVVHTAGYEWTLVGGRLAPAMSDVVLMAPCY